MPAGRGYMFLYRQCTAQLSDEAKLKVDALLGDESAVRELADRRMSTVRSADWDVA